MVLPVPFGQSYSISLQPAFCRATSKLPLTRRAVLKLLVSKPSDIHRQRSARGYDVNGGWRLSMKAGTQKRRNTVCDLTKW